MTPDSPGTLAGVSHAYLMRHGQVVAQLIDARPDMPWFEARFIAEGGFAELEPLFRQELELAESDEFDAVSWQSLWERIWDAGVSLALPDGTRLDRDFAV